MVLPCPLLHYRGIPLLAKDKNARIDAIANQLLTGPDEFDFVFLQEVWSKEDYHKIATKVRGARYVCYFPVISKL